MFPNGIQPMKFGFGAGVCNYSNSNSEMISKANQGEENVTEKALFE